MMRVPGNAESKGQESCRTSVGNKMDQNRNGVNSEADEELQGYFCLVEPNDEHPSSTTHEPGQWFHIQLDLPVPERPFVNRQQGDTPLEMAPERTILGACRSDRLDGFRPLEPGGPEAAA